MGPGQCGCGSNAQVSMCVAVAGRDDQFRVEPWAPIEFRIWVVIPERCDPWVHAGMGLQDAEGGRISEALRSIGKGSRGLCCQGCCGSKGEPYGAWGEGAACGWGCAVSGKLART